MHAHILHKASSEYIYMSNAFSRKVHFKFNITYLREKALHSKKKRNFTK